MKAKEVEIKGVGFKAKVDALVDFTMNSYDGEIKDGIRSLAENVLIRDLMLTCIYGLDSDEIMENYNKILKLIGEDD